jgi:hypothetical protein
MIEAQLGLSREDLDAQRVAVLQSQEARATRLSPLEERMKQAQIRRETLLSDMTELEKAEWQTMTPQRRAMVMAKLAGELQSTSTAAAREAEAREALRQRKELFPIEQETAGARRDLIKEQALDIPAERKARERGKVPMTFIGKDGISHEADVSADRVMEYEGKGWTVNADKRFTQGHTLRTEARAETEAENKLNNEAQKHEAAVFGADDTGKPAIDTTPRERVEVEIEGFNSKSPKDYYLKYFPGKGMFGSGRVVRVPIRDEQGRAMTVRVVYKAWEEFRRMPDAPGGPKHDISFDDYVRLYVRKGK